jgi:D-alanyl-lipoteichoic acid acyltransferase DltB (MBOAT superfamily)
MADLLLSVGFQRDMPFLEIILPVGISFFTFQGISYVVDVYRGHVKPVASPVDLFLYISFFPQLVAGPIVRGSDFLPQLRKPPQLARTAAVYGFLLILAGMLKKTVVAHYIAVDLVDPAFEDPSGAGSADLVAAHYAYAIQVYCDFSGYSDIAIGTAALLGFRFKKNFDRPFSATSMQQLWQRWHISLSTWLRDYLYRALRGKRREAGWRMHRNVFLTMLLGGLWHGANWTFVAWGSILGAALVTERVVKGRWRAWRAAVAGAPTGNERAGGFPGAAAGWFVTFHIFTLAAVFFRSPDIGVAAAYFERMFSMSGGVELFTPFLLLITAGSVAVQFLPGNAIERTAERLRDASALSLGMLLGLGLLAIEFAGPEGVAPFVYFQF